MKRTIYGFLIMILMVSTVAAQKGLAGLWKGTITKGGIYSTQGYDFELYLEVEGKKLKGRTYIYISKEEVIEMQVRGYIYGDRSMNLFEYEFIPQPEKELPPDFDRKYQLIYNRSAFKERNTLNGYWQQIIPTPFVPERERGRILLKKVGVTKA